MDLISFSNISYIMAIVTLIRITSLGMVIRFEIPKKIGIEPGLTFSAFG